MSFSRKSNLDAKGTDRWRPTIWAFFSIGTPPRRPGVSSPGRQADAA
jgi:hypothetical protein